MAIRTFEDDEDETLTGTAPKPLAETIEPPTVTRARAALNPSIDTSRGDATQFRGDVANWFAPEVKAATRAKERAADAQDVLDRFTTTQAAKAQAAKVKEQAAANKQAKKDDKARVEADFRQRGVQFFTDANGDIQPDKDEAGNIRFHRKQGDIQYDEKTGAAFRENRTEKGTKEREDLDANAPIAPHAKQPGRLFKQNKKTPWTDLGTIEDGLQSDDPAIRAAAEAARPGLQEHLTKAARAGFVRRRQEIGAEELEAAKAFGAAKTRSEAIATRIAELEPIAKQQEGWIGFQKPTAAANAAKTEMDALLAEQGNLPIADRSAEFKERRERITLETEAFNASVAKLGSVEAAAEERREEIAAEGGDPDTDPVLLALDEAREKAGLPKRADSEKLKQQRGEAALRERPEFDALLNERDALNAEASRRNDGLSARAAEMEAGLAPLRAQLDEGEAQFNEHSTQAEGARAELEKLLPGEGDLGARLGAMKPAEFLRVQPILSRLNASEEAMRRIQGTLSPMRDQFNAQVQEGNAALSKEQESARTAMQERYDALNGKLDAANTNLAQEALRANLPTLGKQALEADATLEKQMRDRLASDPAYRERLQGMTHGTGRRLDLIELAAVDAKHPEMLDDFARAKRSTAMRARVDEDFGREQLLNKIEQPLWRDISHGLIRGTAKFSLPGMALYGIELVEGLMAPMSDAMTGQKSTGTAASLNARMEEGLELLFPRSTDAPELMSTDAEGKLAVDWSALKKAGWWANNLPENVPQFVSTMGVLGLAEKFALGGKSVNTARATLRAAQTGERIAPEALKAAEKTLRSFQRRLAVGTGMLMESQAQIEDAREHRGGRLTTSDYALATATGLLAGSLEGVNEAAMFNQLRKLFGGAAKPAQEAAKQEISRSLTEFAKRLAKGAAPQMGVEAVTEVLQTGIENAAAKLGWDPERDVRMGMLEAAIIGAVLPAAAYTAGQAVDVQRGKRGLDAQQAAQRSTIDELATMHGMFSPDVVQQSVAMVPTDSARALGAQDTSDLHLRVAEIDAEIQAKQDQLAAPAKAGLVDRALGADREARNATSQSIIELYEQRRQLIDAGFASRELADAAEQIDSLPGSEKFAGQDPSAVAATQNVARGLVKLASGQPMEALTAAERAAVEAPAPDGLPRVEEVAGQIVITQGAIDRLRDVAPAAATLIRSSEAERRAAILQPPAEETAEPATSGKVGTTQQPQGTGTGESASSSGQDGAGVSASTGISPARELSDPETRRARVLAKALTGKGVDAAEAEAFAKQYVIEHGQAEDIGVQRPKFEQAFAERGLPSFEVEVEGEASPRVVRAATEDTARELVAGDPKTKGMVRGVVKVAEAPQKAKQPKAKPTTAAKPTAPPAKKKPSEEDDFFDQSRQVLERQRGTALDKQTTDQLREAVRQIFPALKRWRGAFSGLGWRADSVQSGGLFLTPDGTLGLSLEDILRERRIYEEGGGAELAVLEEAVHALSEDLHRRKVIDLDAIWNECPEAIKAAVRAAYKADNDYQHSREFWRMLIQGRLNLGPGGWSIDGKPIVTEQINPGFLATIRKALAELFKVFSDLRRSLTDAGASQDYITEVERARDLTLERIKEIDAYGKISPDAGPAAPSLKGDESAQANASIPNQPAAVPETAPGSEGGPGTDATVEGGPVRSMLPDDGRGGADSQREAGGRGPEDPGAGAVGDPLGESITLGGEVIPLGAAWEAADQSGTDVYRGKWALVPLDRVDVQRQLGEGQNRIDRVETGRAARVEMKRNLHAGNVRLKWSDSPGIDTGAPVMETNGRVLSGNNRTLALLEMQEEQGGKAAIYDQAARAEAAKLGLDTNAFPGRAVGLIRVVEPGLSGRSTEEFVEQTNTAAVEQLSEADKAAQDRALLGEPGLLESLNPLEDGRFNTDFLNAFDRALGSPKELRKPDGALDLAKVERRAQAALLSHLLGTGQGADAVLVSLLSNLTTPGVKQVVAGLAKAGPALLHAAALNPDVAGRVIATTGRALTMLLDYRRARDAGEVQSVRDWLAQGNLFESAPDTLFEKVLERLSTARSANAVSESFLRFAKAIEDYGDPGQERLFGPEPAPDPLAFLGTQPQTSTVAERLWDIAQAEPMENRALTAEEVARWSRVYRTLHEQERAGTPLNGGQRAMFERAERMLGQRLMFGDETKAARPMEEFRLEQETVRVAEPRAEQGMLFTQPQEDAQTVADATPTRPAGTMAEAGAAVSALIGEPITNRDDGMVATISGNTASKMLSGSALKKSVSPQAHFAAVAHVDQLFAGGVRGASGPDIDGDPNIRAMHRYYAPLRFGGETLLAKLTVKEFARASEGNRIYSVEALEIVKPARNWVASISAQERRNYTPQAGFEEKILAKIDAVNRAADDTLRSQPQQAASPETAQQLTDDERMAREGGKRIFDLGDGLQVTRAGGETRRELLDEIWPMYQRAYGAIGAQYSSPEALLSEPTLFDVVRTADGRALAFNVNKITDWGYKSVASGQDGTEEGKRAWRTNHRRLKNEGYYGEFSGAPRHIAEKENLPTVPAAEAARILGKTVAALPDGEAYTREITIKGLTEPHEKRMFGLPVLWKSRITPSESSMSSSEQSTTPAPPMNSGPSTETNSPPSPTDSPTKTSSPTTSEPNTPQIGSSEADTLRSQPQTFDLGTRGLELFDRLTPQQQAVAIDLARRLSEASAADKAATAANPSPTEPQKEAGNYRKGHTRIAGLDISIENAAGSERSGTDGDGKGWSVTMGTHYGYIRRTEGKDGDHVDVLIKPGTPDDWTGTVYVVNQPKRDGGFDEHKVVLGAATEEEARALYLSNYSPGWKVGTIAPMAMDTFKTWLAKGDLTKPARVPRAAYGWVSTGTPAELVRSNLARADAIAATFDNIPGVEPDDVRQVARTALFRAARTYGENPRSDEFGGLAATAIKNALRSFYQQRTRDRNVPTLDVQQDEDAAPGSALVAEQSADVVRNATRDEGFGVLRELVAALPGHLRTVVEGVMDGDSYTEIGARIGEGMTKQGVHNRLKIANTRLRAALSQRGVKSPDDLILRTQPQTDEQGNVDPVAETMRLLDLDALEGLTARAAAEPAGSFNVGRPDLALGAEGPGIRALHAWHTATLTKQTFEEWDTAAEELLANPESAKAFADDLTRRWLNGDRLRPYEVRAAQKLLVDLQQASGTDSAAKERFYTFGYAYAKIGADTARELAARRDPFKTPEERTQQYLAEAVTAIDAETQAKIDALKPEERVTALQAALRERKTKVDAAIESVMGKGVTMDDILTGQVVLRLKGAPIVQNIIESFDEKKQRAFRLLQGGSKTFEDVAKEVKLTPKEVEAVRDEFVAEFRRRHFEKFKRGLKADQLEVQPGLLAQPQTADDAASADAEAEFQRALKMMGIVSKAEQGKYKVVKRRRRPRPAGSSSATYTGPVPSDRPIGPPADRQGDLLNPERNKDRSPTGALPVGGTSGSQTEVFGEATSADRAPTGIDPVDLTDGRQERLDLPFEEWIYRRELVEPALAARVVRAIQTVNGPADAMLYEYWINAILSGPQTHVVNILGNAVSSVLDFTVQRGMEAFINLFARDANSAHFGEFNPILRGFVAGIAPAFRLAAQAWSAETDLFRSHVLDQQMEMFEEFEKSGGIPPAIGGRTGRVVRMPGRALLFFDTLFKMIIGRMEAGAQAYRIARNEGLRDDALTRRMSVLINTPGSEAWHRAVTKATELTFQEKSAAGKMLGFAKSLQRSGKLNERLAGFLVGFVIPFVNAPWNIGRMGFRKTPLGTLNMLVRYGHAGLMRMRNGKMIGQTYDPALQIKHLAEQVLAFAAIAAVWGAAQGDPDDDEKNFLITGSLPFGETTPGERDLQNRAFGGAYQIRIGGRNGTSFNYGRYEPIATVLGTVVDAIRAIKRPQPAPERMDALWGYFMSQVEGKTFLQGVSNFMRAFRDPQGAISEIPKGWAQALVPNIIRQPLRNLDDYVRDTKGGGLPYAMLPSGANAPEKLDVYGKPIEKGGNALARLLFPVGTKPSASLSAADQLLLRWNTEHPSEKWAPQAPPRTYRKAGKDVEMTADEYREFTEKVGRNVSMKLAGRITPAMVRAPKEADVKFIREAFEKARSEERERMFPQISAGTKLRNVMWN